MRVLIASLLTSFTVLSAAPTIASDGVALKLSVDAKRQLTVSVNNDSGLDICPSDSGAVQQLEVSSQDKRIAPVNYVQGRPIPGCNSNVVNATDTLRKGMTNSQNFDLPLVFNLGPQAHGTVCMTFRYRFLTYAADVRSAEENEKRACASF